MQIVRHFRALTPQMRGGAVALGNFDGVHLGHQALIGAAKARAAALSAPLIAAAFEPHPAHFFKPDLPAFRLTPFRARAELLAQAGADIHVPLRFNAALAGMSAEAFAQSVLAEGFGVRHVVVGSDFRFGKGRSGDVDVLTELGARFGFGVTPFDLIETAGGEKISSTAIRRALQEGRPEAAAAQLGRLWSVTGHVRRGDQRGRGIGFPTANLALRGTLEPAIGVYAVRIRALGRDFTGVANFGRRPTFDKTDVLLEAHLFDFSGDLYGRSIEVRFAHYLRGERRFDGLDSLKRQIAADAGAARAFFALSQGSAAL